MFYFGAVCGLIVGAGAAWGITYVYFRGVNKKLVAKLAAIPVVGADAAKVAAKV